MTRRHIASWERGRCPRAGLQPAPGRLGYQPPGIMTGVGGASLDWDRRRRVTPVQTTSQEAWPEAEPLGWNTPLGESRGGTPSSVRAPKGRAPHRKMRRLVTLRLPAFRFLQFSSFFVARMERSAIRERRCERRSRSRIALRSIRATKLRNQERKTERQAPPLAFFYPNRFRD
jgi:hypothetical protein